MHVLYGSDEVVDEAHKLITFIFNGGRSWAERRDQQTATFHFSSPLPCMLSSTLAFCTTALLWGERKKRHKSMLARDPHGRTLLISSQPPVVAECRIWEREKEESCISSNSEVLWKLPVQERANMPCYNKSRKIKDDTEILSKEPIIKMLFFYIFIG